MANQSQFGRRVPGRHSPVAPRPTSWSTGRWWVATWDMRLLGRMELGTGLEAGVKGVNCSAMAYGPPNHRDGIGLLPG